MSNKHTRSEGQFRNYTPIFICFLFTFVSEWEGKVSASETAALNSFKLWIVSEWMGVLYKKLFFSVFNYTFYSYFFKFAKIFYFFQIIWFFFYIFVVILVSNYLFCFKNTDFWCQNIIISILKWYFVLKFNTWLINFHFFYLNLPFLKWKACVLTKSTTYVK